MLIGAVESSFSSGLSRAVELAFNQEGIFTVSLAVGAVQDEAGNENVETIIVRIEFNSDACVTFPCLANQTCTDLFPGLLTAEGRSCLCFDTFSCLCRRYQQ